MNMVPAKLPKYLLQEQPDITEAINYPLKSAQRIKYTCFDVSKSLIVFGATSGGIYIFNRNPCEFIQLIPNKDGAIIRVAISPDERHVGFANGRGTILVTESNLPLTGTHSSMMSKEHHGNEVTTMVWNMKNILFAGDDCGKVSVLQIQNFIYTCFDVSKSLIVFGATSGGIYIFNRNPCEFIQLIPNKDGAIIRVAISPDERHVGFANGRGTILVTESNLPLTGTHSSMMSKEHHGNEVTTMVWNMKNILFAGDDCGKVSVLQIQNFITKKIFQSSSQTIMSLDSRICQLDVKDDMLLVSTFTRCYLCDTSQEQYRQIGQKLRDGEFGACLLHVNKKNENVNGSNPEQNFAEVKRFNIINEETNVSIDRDLDNALIYCARPSSRLWESTSDGVVRRTHQFKQVLARKPMDIVTVESYNSDNVSIKCFTEETNGQSVHFTKLYTLGNSIIFSYKKDAIYFLCIDNVEDTVWYDKYKNIVECKVLYDIVYLWLANGDLVTLNLFIIEKFLLKCYIDGKYKLCGELCALYNDYLLSNTLSINLHLLVGLRDKLVGDPLEKISEVLKKFDSLKSKDATQMESGIYVVDNSYYALSQLNGGSCGPKYDQENVLVTLPPEALQTLKDLGHTVTDKLNSSKRILRHTWDDFEDKMKHLGSEKQEVNEVIIPRRTVENSINELVPIVYDKDIVYKESSHKPIEIDDSDKEQNELCRLLYECYGFSLVGRKMEHSNLVSIIESNTCDIRKVYEIMLQLEQYCLSVGALESNAKLAANYIFLSYLNLTAQKELFLNSIVGDEVLYKYFVDSCISVNVNSNKYLSIGCECGHPLPFLIPATAPVFNELIDEFIEKQWRTSAKDRCYEMCKKMPYLWRKILHLKRNENLLDVLTILLQILDETLLHKYLPQFTLETWDRAVLLYATLNTNVCLNCEKKFNHISVKERLSWEQLGALMIKSIGSRNALKILEKHAALIGMGALTSRFYHTCLIVALYVKHDVTITNQLTDAMFEAYDYEDARDEIRVLLRNSVDGCINSTALPLIAAAKTVHWGLNKNESQGSIALKVTRSFTFQDAVDNLHLLTDSIDCSLCGLPLKNAVLIKDGGLWVFKCGHLFHGACLVVNKIKLCPHCPPKV